MAYHRNKISLSWFFIFTVSVLCVGCYSKPRPKDLPKLYPCTLTFTYADGSPVDDALISLYSDDPSYKWMAGGRTDSSGKVGLATNGQYPGVPEGRFHVVIAKTESVRNGKKMEPDETLTEDEPVGVIQVYTYIEKQFAERKSTPLEVTIVPKGENDQTFLCGKPTRVLLTTIIP